jgi:hypothetical protein
MFVLLSSSHFCAFLSSFRFSSAKCFVRELRAGLAAARALPLIARRQFVSAGILGLRMNDRRAHKVWNITRALDCFATRR